MTVRDWITSRVPPAPGALIDRVLSILGADAGADERRTGELCLAAAVRSLDALLAQGRFGRDSAFELLTVDALTTYAFEHAAQASRNESELEALARSAARKLGQLTAQRV